jgi:hypothetical protein
MAKIRNTTYWNGSDLYNDADVPGTKASNITYDATHIYCSNISTRDIRTALVASTDDMYTLCNLSPTYVAGGENNKINAWSRYKSGYVTYNSKLPAACNDNPTFTWNVSNPLSWGDWAGYNHTENTRPVYWSDPPSSSYSLVIGGVTQEIKNGLKRGKCGSVLTGDPEDEYYWGRVKVQVWKKTGLGGTYALHSTTGYIDLDDPDQVLCELGTMGESVSTTYYICLRPVYINVSDDIEAVIEDGVQEFSYYIQTISEYFDDLGIFTFVDDGTTSNYSSPYWSIEMNYHINNTGGSYELYFKYKAIEESSGAWDESFYHGQFIITNGSPGHTVSSYNAGNLSHHADTPDTTFRVDILLSIDGINYSTMATIATGLVYKYP